MTIKRFFDCIVLVPLLFFALPFIALISILIWLEMGRPVIFTQVRPGYKGVPFTVYKFRTMRQAFDKNGRLLPDKLRLTPLGRFLRQTSLDELPELWNVAKADMSLVGPRPLLMQYLARYTPEQARRHEVTPGITGWAQVNGRNAISWEDKFKLDLWYVDRRSILLDIKIILLTVWKIVTREGINQPGCATAEEFKGKERK